MAELLADTKTLESTTVGIFRNATVVKGGRRFSFAALVVVGDRQGSVGIGYGKAPGVPAAIEKAQKDARKQIFKVTLKESTLPHPVTGRFLASKVRLLPAAPGTGVIAGGTVRAVLEMAGVHDCLTKAYGSTNKKNLCKAVIEGLMQLRIRETVAAHRGVEIEKTVVDEVLEAGRRYMVEAESETASTRISDAAKVNQPKASKKDQPKPSGSPEVQPKAEAIATAESAEPAEAPTPQAEDQPAGSSDGDPPPAGEPGEETPREA